MTSSYDLERRYQLLAPISLAWIRRLKDLGVSVDSMCEPELPAMARVIISDGFRFDFYEGDGQPVDAMILLAPR